MTDELKQWEYDKGYTKGYSDGRASLIEELEKVKNRIDYVRNCGMGKNKSLEYIEKYINKEISELKGEQE